MTSADSIRALIASGWSRAAIGRAVGRDDSLIGQIERARKPGRNLEAALAELVARGPVGSAAAGPQLPAIPRRAQRVRRPTSRGGAKWTTGQVKRQAARAGGRSLAPVISEARADDRRLSFTLLISSHAAAGIRYGRALSPAAVSAGLASKHRARRRVEELRVGGGGQGLSAAALDRYLQRHSGDVNAALVAYVRDHVPGAGHIAETDVHGIEVSSWK